MNNPIDPNNPSTPWGTDGKKQQSIEERIALAAGYAVLARRAGSTVEEVVSELMEVYQLNDEQAMEAWEMSKQKFKNENRKVTGETHRNVSTSTLIGVFSVALYALLWTELSPFVSILLLAFCVISLLGLLLFIIQYSRISLVQPKKFYFSKRLSFEMSDEKNKVVQYVPLAIFVALLAGAMYWFDANVYKETEGKWINGIIKAFGERGFTGSKSKSYYTILALGSPEIEYRLYDRELKYADLPPDSFRLQPGNRVAIFVVDPGWEEIGGGGFAILNLRQEGRVMANLDHRNAMVRAQNLRWFWQALIICAAVLAISLGYGFYLHKQSLTSGSDLLATGGQ